jgi:hypothetical protein
LLRELPDGEPAFVPFDEQLHLVGREASVHLFWGCWFRAVWGSKGRN